MPRGVAHPPALRAQVIAEIASGEPLTEVARRHGISKANASRWWSDGTVGTVGTDNGRAQEALSALIYGLAVDTIITLRAQLQAASDPRWLAKQNASELAELVGAEHDRLVRLLAGLRPAGARALPDSIDQ